MYRIHIIFIFNIYREFLFRYSRSAAGATDMSHSVVLLQPFKFIGFPKSVTPCVPLQVRRGPRTVQSETKYVELLVVNDYELVRSPIYLLFSYSFLHFFM